MPKIRKNRKIMLILFGILVSLFLIEIILRGTGFFIFLIQKTKNRTDVKEYRVLALGESTTANLLNGQSSWPEELEHILNKKNPNIKFKVFNEGRGGTNTAFIASRLNFNLDKYQPYMVITMMGLNDDNLDFVYTEDSTNIFVKAIKNMKLYKLSKWLFISLRYAIRGKSAEEPKLISEDNIINNSRFDLIKQSLYFYDFNKAKEILEKELKTNPDNDQLYYLLGSIYFNNNSFEKASKMFLKSIEINPDNYDSYVLLSVCYKELEKYKENKELLEKAWNLNPYQDWQNKDFIYTELGHTYQILGFPENELKRYYEKNEFTLLSQDFEKNITKYHYKKMYDILNKRGIKYVAMQYPTLDANNLRNFFEGNEDIIFVSNEENFREALKNTSYNELFIDEAGGTFGHATKLGNILIAENVAKVILNEINMS